MGAAANGFAISDLDDACARVRPALAALDGAGLFVTGGSGFFGRWLIALLARARETGIARCNVTALTRSPESFAAACPDVAGQSWLILCEGDVRYFEFPKGRFTHVIHAATDTSAAADANPRRLIGTIVEGARRVLDFAEMAGVKRLLHVSSGAVYGAQPGDVERLPENFSGACDPLDPRSAYGQAKRMAEHLCAHAAKGGLDAVIARGFAFVGPGQPLDGHFAIGNFIGDALAGRPIRVNGDGTPLRSYLYAADLAAWLVALLANGESGAAYNVGSDQEISIGDLARLVARELNAPGVEIARAADGKADFRSRYIPSIDKARRQLGLDVFTPLDQAILRTASWARAHAATPRPAAAHRNEHAKDAKALTFVVDVDGVVASLSKGNDYTLCEPLTGTIEKINTLYERGHRIVMFTARGSATGLDWSEVTRAQFARWGLKFHELHFGKPAGDYYIDDRLISLPELDAICGTSQ